MDFLRIFQNIPMFTLLQILIFSVGSVAISLNDISMDVALGPGWFIW
jgi:hypothetical protein